MNKIIVFLLVCTMGLGAMSCSDINGNEINSFSYAQHYDAYCKGESGGRLDGFKNNTKTIAKNKEQVINLAKNEVTIEYNQINVYFDESSSMWMVVFSTKGMNDGCQNVYINTEGLTKLIVYGG